jgi:predicted TIM-barrel fold metal-dependent hydrolase
MMIKNKTMSPFTNSHAHIFTVNHAPDYFLKTAIANETMAVWIDKFLQKKGTRWAMKGLLQIFTFLSPRHRDTVRRYIEFVEIGTSASQEDIYNQVSMTYKKFGEFRIVVLTQVLDYLDLERSSNHIKIRTQVEEVCMLKRHALYQQTIFPFLGLDPRQAGIDLLNDWVLHYINPDKGFCGIKIYPAAGFFPFDIRLDAVWKYAADNGIPIMTHCTRSGSFYLGRRESILNTGGLVVQSLNPASPSMSTIETRVNSVVNDKSIIKNNRIWCNVFGHPENYRPVLEKYNNLKICLAHVGGASEINRSSTDTGGYPSYLTDNWYDEVIALMKDYPNVYSDISYTLSDQKALKKIAFDFREPSMVDRSGTPLMNKLLYGTDYYLTQQEKFGDEPDLQNLFLGVFSKAEIQLLAYTNPAKFL